MMNRPTTQIGDMHNYKLRLISVVKIIFEFNVIGSGNFVVFWFLACSCTVFVVMCKITLKVLDGYT